MYPILLAISFILHLLAFFWIILLSMRLKRITEVEHRQVEIQKEIEDLFESYLLEMKEENEKFLYELEKTSNTNVAKQITGSTNGVTTNISNHTNIANQKDTAEPYKPAANLRGKMTQQMYQNQLLQRSKNGPVSPSKANQNNYEPPVPTEEDQFEQSLTSQIVLLHNKGLNTDEIAQKLNKGKAEIELLLKFSRKNDN